MPLFEVSLITRSLSKVSQTTEILFFFSCVKALDCALAGLLRLCYLYLFQADLMKTLVRAGNTLLDHGAVIEKVIYSAASLYSLLLHISYWHLHGWSNLALSGRISRTPWSAVSENYQTNQWCRLCIKVSQQQVWLLERFKHPPEPFVKEKYLN